MPRPIKEKIRDIKWWGEQVGHATGGAAVALPLALVFRFVLPSEPVLLLSALFLGSIAGGTRELIQNWDDPPETNDLKDSHFDSMAFAVGAFLITAALA